MPAGVRSPHRRLLLACGLALTGCHFERGPNVAGVAGVWIDHGTTPTDEGTTGGISARLQAVEIGEPAAPFIVSSSAALAVGGNADGAAAQANLSSELGWAPAFDGAHHVFLRGGLAATVEVDPYTAYYAFEFPTATLGYTFHPRGDGIVEATHFEIAAHGGVLDASHARVDRLEMDRVGALEIGPLADFKTGAFSARLGYLAVFRERVVHLIQSSTCVGLGFVACVETRHMTYPDAGLGLNGTIGVTFGIGWVAGVFPR
ncbi:MAG: hypothetical protein U0414_37230 [Polyangiaceae bacterium]